MSASTREHSLTVAELVALRVAQHDATKRWSPLPPLTGVPLAPRRERQGETRTKPETAQTKEQR